MGRSGGGGKLDPCELISNIATRLSWHGELVRHSAVLGVLNWRGRQGKIGRSGPLGKAFCCGDGKTYFSLSGCIWGYQRQVAIVVAMAGFRRWARFGREELGLEIRGEANQSEGGERGVPRSGIPEHKHFFVAVCPLDLAYQVTSRRLSLIWTSRSRRRLRLAREI